MLKARDPATVLTLGSTSKVDSLLDDDVSVWLGTDLKRMEYNAQVKA